MFRVLQCAAESPHICDVRGELIVDLLKDLRKAAKNPRFSALLRDAGRVEKTVMKLLHAMCVRPSLTSHEHSLGCAIFLAASRPPLLVRVVGKRKWQATRGNFVRSPQRGG